MDIKIGKSTDIENTLRQYSRGNRDIELLDMWTPNPDKTLSTAERGVHAVAEKYSYDKQSEKFVFLQGAYQEFAETVNMLLQNVSREDLVLVPCRHAVEPPQNRQRKNDLLILRLLVISSEEVGNRPNKIRLLVEVIDHLLRDQKPHLNNSLDTVRSEY